MYASLCDYARIVCRVDGVPLVVMVYKSHNRYILVNLRILSLKEVTAKDYIVFY